MGRALMRNPLLIAGLVLVLYSSCVLSNAPVLSDLRPDEHLPITSSLSGDAWVVSLTLDVLHDDNGANPIAKVSNLTLKAYNYEEYNDPTISPVPVATYIDHPFHPNEGDSVDDHPVSIEVPKSASGHLVIEVCAKHGNDWGCTTWEGWIPQEPKHGFTGSLQIHSDWNPRASGVFEGGIWTLHIQACAEITVSLSTDDCRLTRAGFEDPRYEIPTEWRVWDDHGGVVINTGWLAAAVFEEMFENADIVVPSGWSGEIYFQLRMTRYGLGDYSGDYSAALTVDVLEDE